MADNLDGARDAFVESWLAERECVPAPVAEVIVAVKSVRGSLRGYA